MRHRFNTSVGTIEIAVHEGDRILSAYRLDSEQRPVVAATENWDEIDFEEMLIHRVGVPPGEASEIVASVTARHPSMLLPPPPAQPAQWGSDGETWRTDISPGTSDFPSLRWLLLAASLVAGYLIWTLFTQPSDDFQWGMSLFVLLAIATVLWARSRSATWMPPLPPRGPWQPATRLQYEAVWRLKPHGRIGSWARTVSPGMDEVVVDIGGAARRYLVMADGSITLAQGGERTPACRRARRVRIAGAALLLSVLFAAQENVPSWMFWFGVVVGAAVVVAGIVASPPGPKLARGEWVKIYPNND